MYKQETLMDKSLTVYPIPTGNELNIFASENISTIKIMDMQGAVVYECTNTASKKNTVDIKHLPEATYIVEVAFENKKTGRSVFVKL
jgi:hypothetical protein